MKILLKYIWTLIFIPAILFVKGDLSWDWFSSINEIQSSNEITKRMQESIKPPPLRVLEFHVNAISDSNNFSADGIRVELYDVQYNLIETSQVIDNRVRFLLDPKYSNLQHVKVVCPLTADELKVDMNKPDIVFSIHEKHIAENEFP